MDNPHTFSASAPVVPALILPGNGLAAVQCPGCKQFHLHHAARGVLRPPCGFGTYRLWVRGTADAAMAARIRDALETKHRNERREAPSSMS